MQPVVITRVAPTPPRACAAALAVAVAMSAACADLGGPDEELGSVTLGSTVSDFAGGGSCTTAVVLGLSRQIADEVRCLEPDSLGPFSEGDGIVFTGAAVLPYMDPKASADLSAAVAAHGGELRINSALRTVAQQYLLYAWYQRGVCSIAKAAKPGLSNHESGRAVDVENYADWTTALGNHAWAHDVPGDAVHFDHLSSPDLRGYDTLAFQRLWNRNHPDDEIDEDGLYGGQTEARLTSSPADGFEQGACGSAFDAQLVTVDAPDVLGTGERGDVVVTVKNTGVETWRPGSTFLGTAGPQDRESALYDPSSWPSPTRAASVEAQTAPGEVGAFRFTIVAPEMDETTLHESFRLVDGDDSWFGPTSIDLELLVSNSASVGSGCAVSAAPSADATLPLAALLLVALTARLPRRRRRSRAAQ